MPFAMYYCHCYDKFGSIDRARVPVFISVHVVNTARNLSAIKRKATEYANAHTAVTIFVQSQNIDAPNNTNWNIKIIADNNAHYAFISDTQTELELNHCMAFLETLSDIEGLQFS
jgi:hypothetical protein